MLNLISLKSSESISLYPKPYDYNEKTIPNFFSEDSYVCQGLGASSIYSILNVSVLGGRSELLVRYAFRVPLRKCLFLFVLLRCGNTSAEYVFLEVDLII